MHHEQNPGEHRPPDEHESLGVVAIGGLESARVIEDCGRFLEADAMLHQVRACLRGVPFEIAFDDGRHRANIARRRPAGDGALVQRAPVEAGALRSLGTSKLRDAKVLLRNDRFEMWVLKPSSLLGWVDPEVTDVRGFSSLDGDRLSHALTHRREQILPW